MNFRQLLIIRETVRSNFNLTEVANRLLTAQSGVSKHVKDLEEEIGAELFIRRGKRLMGLTDAGRDAVEIIERMLLDADNLLQVGSCGHDKNHGILRIVTTHTLARYTLPPVIASFNKSYPDVQLAIRQVSSAEFAALLLSGEADIAISNDALENALGLAVFPYFSWEHAVVVPAGHPLERSEQTTLHEIAKWPLITYAYGITGRDRIDETFAQAGLAHNVAISALDADVIKSFVEQGLGVGIIAEMAFDRERDHKLRRVKVANLFPTGTATICIRRGCDLRRYVYRFVELCVPTLTEVILRQAV